MTSAFRTPQRIVGRGSVVGGCRNNLKKKKKENTFRQFTSVYFNLSFLLTGSKNACALTLLGVADTRVIGIYYEGWNFNSGNYLFTTDTK